MSYLERVNSPRDLKTMSFEELGGLAEEVRQAVISRVEAVGGHFGSNLGVVELTVALHYVFDTPKDKIVFDVSHQCYPHKILTGRKNAFLEPSLYDSISGFTVPSESEYDVFQVGHTSSSVSLACGLAKARDFTGGTENIIAVIGDGSLSGGEAFEGLDNVATLNSNCIVIFNDNEMSIAENHGGIYQNLQLLRDTNGKAELNLFKAIGLNYVYVEQGNDLKTLIDALQQVKDSKTPVVVHVHTLKGKGYPKAVENKEQYHWFGGLNAKKGNTVRLEKLTAEYLLKKMATDKTLVAINSASPSAQGWTPDLRQQAGDQFIDTGITEQHTFSFASGLAKNGAKPVLYIGAPFMSRAFDQLMQDIALNDSPVVILGTNCSLSGADATHVGSFEAMQTCNMPNLVCLSPVFCEEYFAMLDWALSQREKAVFIRIPNSNVSGGNTYDVTHPSIEKGEKVAFIGVGESYFTVEKCAQLYKQKTGMQPIVINQRNYGEIDENELALLQKCDVVVTVEYNLLEGGFGAKVAMLLGKSNAKVLCYGGKKEFTNRVPLSVQKQNYRLHEDLIVADVLQLV